MKKTARFQYWCSLLIHFVVYSSSQHISLIDISTSQGSILQCNVKCVGNPHCTAFTLQRIDGASSRSSTNICKLHRFKTLNDSQESIAIPGKNDVTMIVKRENANIFQSNVVEHTRLIPPSETMSTEAERVKPKPTREPIVTEEPLTTELLTKTSISSKADPLTLATDDETKTETKPITERPTPGWSTATEPTTKANTTPLTEPSTKATTTPLTEPSTKATTTPLTEPSTKATTTPLTEPSTKATTTPLTEPSTKATTTSLTEPSTKATTTPLTEPSTKATTTLLTEPSTKATTTPLTEPSTKATTTPLTEPSTKATTTPLTEPSTSISVTSTLRPTTVSLTLLTYHKLTAMDELGDDKYIFYWNDQSKKRKPKFSVVNKNDIKTSLQENDIANCFDGFKSDDIYSAFTVDGVSYLLIQESTFGTTQFQWLKYRIDLSDEGLVEKGFKVDGTISNPAASVNSPVRASTLIGSDTVLFKGDSSGICFHKSLLESTQITDPPPNEECLEILKILTGNPDFQGAFSILGHDKSTMRALLNQTKMHQL